MILHILMFKNHQLDCFTTPNFVDVEPNVAATQLKRSIITGIAENDKKAYQYRNLELFHVGDFDDVTGKITQFDSPIALLDCRAIYPDDVQDGK